MCEISRKLGIFIIFSKEQYYVDCAGKILRIKALQWVAKLLSN